MVFIPPKIAPKPLPAPKPQTPTPAHAPAPVAPSAPAAFASPVAPARAQLLRAIGAPDAPPATTLATENARDGSRNCLDAAADWLALAPPEIRARAEVLFLQDTRPGAEGQTGHVVIRQGDTIFDPLSGRTSPSFEAFNAEGNYRIAGAASGTAVHRILSAPPGSPERDAAIARARLDPALVNMPLADPPPFLGDVRLIPVEITQDGETGVNLGTLSYVEGTSYSDNVQFVLGDDANGANYCASTTFRGLAGASDWPSGTPEAIEDVLTTYRNTSSVSVWEQISHAYPANGSNIPLTAGVDQTIVLRPEQPLPITLTGSNGNALQFTAEEIQVARDPNEDIGNDTPLQSLDEMEVGDVRAVVMRPLTVGGAGNTAAVGHWVIVERTETGYRVTQSAPENWVLLGGTSDNTGGASPTHPDGGLYVHEFDGDTALQDVSAYLHAEAQYSEALGTGTNDQYGLVVLAPVTSDQP